MTHRRNEINWSDVSEAELRAHLYALVAEGLLDVEHDAYGDPTFEISGRSDEVFTMVTVPAATS